MKDGFAKTIFGREDIPMRNLIFSAMNLDHVDQRIAKDGFSSTSVQRFSAKQRRP
jgi:hypothetical protein